jgi:hypothetical protein
MKIKIFTNVYLTLLGIYSSGIEVNSFFVNLTAVSFQAKPKTLPSCELKAEWLTCFS